MYMYQVQNRIGHQVQLLYMYGIQRQKWFINCWSCSHNKLYAVRRSYRVNLK